MQMHVVAQRRDLPDAHQLTKGPSYINCIPSSSSSRSQLQVGSLKPTSGNLFRSRRRSGMSADAFEFRTEVNSFAARHQPCRRTSAACGVPFSARPVCTGGINGLHARRRVLRLWGAG
eukprot:5387269-Prymnesium_polylepis.2